MGVVLWFSRVVMVLFICSFLFVVKRKTDENTTKKEAIPLLVLAIVYQFLAIAIHPLVGVITCIGVIGTIIVGYIVNEEEREHATWGQSAMLYTFVIAFSAGLIVECTETILGRLF